MALYAVTRTFGIPFFGPRAWQVQEPSAIDLAAELALILLLTTMLEGILRARMINALFVLGIVVWVLVPIGAFW